MCSHEISSVSDLLEILKEIGEPKQGHTRFFRGRRMYGGVCCRAFIGKVASI